MTKPEVRGFLKSYGAKFREMREKAELSQVKVAKILGCSQAIISHIECGYMLPPRKLKRH